MSSAFSPNFFGGAVFRGCSEENRGHGARGKSGHDPYGTVYSTPEDVKELLGTDLEGHYVVGDVKVEPKYGKDIVISHDDFVLRDMEAVEKSTPSRAQPDRREGALIIARNEDGNRNQGAGAAKIRRMGGMAAP